MDNEGIKRVYFEVEIMQKLQHKNILQVKTITEHNENVYIIMELIRNGDLLEYVNTKKKLTEEEARKIFIQILDSLEYTHNKNIIHRDIKLENILLNENNEIILGDWGFAGYWSNDKKIKCKWGSIFYSAPEIILGNEYTGPEIDIWSLGVVLYAMVTGRLPFAGDNNFEVAKNIVMGNYKIPSYCSSDLTDLIYSILQVDQNIRFNISQIKAHPWFSGEEKISNSNTSIVKPVEEEPKIIVNKQVKKKSKISLLLSKITFKDKSKSSIAVVA